MEKEKKSFIVTGASASGKTTLINLAKEDGYIYLPTHMTRKPRVTEINHVDAIFLNNQEFENNFFNGDYLEDTLEFAFLQSLNVYYGTPKKWLNYLSGNGYCATPVSIKIASEIKRVTNVMWIHLYCDEIDRYNRLLSRGISESEAKKRMNSGDSINFPDMSDINVNTSKEEPTKILKKVREL